MNLNNSKLAAALVFVMATGVAQGQSLGISQWQQDVKVVAAGQGATPPSLAALMADNVKATQSAMAIADVPAIRSAAIQEAAASVGARAGLAKGLTDFDAALKRQAGALDKIYNFSSLAMSVPMRPGLPATYPNPKTGNGEFVMVLPPVILEGLDADSFPSDDEMRIAERTYKIYAKARLLPVDKATGRPAVPDWRDYLVFSFREVEMPHPSLLPRTEGEKALWNEWVSRGWAEGGLQAKQLLDGGWSRLDRDFKGMTNYQRAYAQGLATRPQVAGVNMGVTGGGTEMRINDRTVRITDHSALVPDTSRWSTSDPK